MDQGGEVRPELDSAVVPSVRGQPGASCLCSSLAYNLGNFLRRLCLPKAVKHWSLRSVQVKLIKMGGRLVRHSRAVDLSVIRGCRFLEGCSRECWIASAGYLRRQAEGGYNHDLAKRGRALPGSRLCRFNHAFTPLAGARRR